MNACIRIVADLFVWWRIDEQGQGIDCDSIIISNPITIIGMRSDVINYGFDVVSRIYQNLVNAGTGCDAVAESADIS